MYVLVFVNYWAPILYNFVHEYKSKSNLRCRKYDSDMYYVIMSGRNVLVVFSFLCPKEVEKAEKGKGLIIHLREKLFLDDLLLINFILTVSNETNDQFLPTHLHATDIYITAFSSIYSCKIAALAFRIQNTIKAMTKT